MQSNSQQRLKYGAGGSLCNHGDADRFDMPQRSSNVQRSLPRSSLLRNVLCVRLRSADDAHLRPVRQHDLSTSTASRRGWWRGDGRAPGSRVIRDDVNGARSTPSDAARCGRRGRVRCLLAADLPWCVLPRRHRRPWSSTDPRSNSFFLSSSLLWSTFA